MNKLLCSCLLVSLLCPSLWAQPTPKPARDGDYWVRNENTWLDWEVTGDELAGRLAADWPADDQVPGALLGIDWQVKRWPMLHKWVKGERLKAYPDPAGGTLIKDFDGCSWMRVSLEGGGFCFVRANAKYLKPVAGATVVQTSQPTETTGQTPAVP